MAKTNTQHLRDICADNDEAIEFIDAVEEEIKELESEMDDYKKEISDLEDEVMSLKNSIEEEPEFNTIHTGIGTLHWQADNLLLQQIAEALEPAFKRNPNAVLAALEALR